jgi:hypothetical protein
MDKKRLVRFMAKIMEESGFKVYRNFQTSRHIVDIYGVMPTILGDIGVVVACKNYDERWEVGLDVLKEMEMVAKTLKASKVVVVTTSYFTNSAMNYAGRRNIKIIDKDALLVLAKRFSQHKPDLEEQENQGTVDDNNNVEEYIPPSRNKSRFSLGFLSRGKQSLSRGSGKSLATSTSLSERLKPILSNTISLIVIVVVLSYFLTYLVTMGYKNSPIVGISQILISAILSYALALYFERDATKTLIKGTTVFFVSMIVIVLIIVFS